MQLRGGRVVNKLIPSNNCYQVKYIVLRQTMSTSGRVLIYERLLQTTTVCISCGLGSVNKGNCYMSAFKYFDYHTPVFSWSLFKSREQLLPISHLFPVSHDFLLSHLGHCSHISGFSLVCFHYSMTTIASNSRSLEWLMDKKKEGTGQFGAQAP